MYLVGQVVLDLKGGTVQLRPPANFFGGVANLLTQHSWETRDQMETYKLLSLTQSANRALMNMGVNDVVRVAVGNEVVYEDLELRADDFDAAIRALEDRLQQGFNPDPCSEFDLILRYQDDVLTYVIDLDFVREHHVGEHPLAITVTAVPVELRREQGVDRNANDTYEARIAPLFASQEAFDTAQERWKQQLEGFLDRIAEHFRTNLGISQVSKDVVWVLPRRRDWDSLVTRTGFGYPLYGFDPGTDLAYILLWDTLWRQHEFRVRDIYYGDDYFAATGIGWAEAPHHEGGRITHKTEVLDHLDVGIEPPDPSHRGWLSDIGDFFSDIGGESGGGSGGGDGGGDGGGGGCGGGGCGGG